MSRRNPDATESPADLRPFVKVDVGLPWNDKIEEVAAHGHPVAEVIAAQVVALCKSASAMADGHFAAGAVERLAGTGGVLTKAMISEGLWHEPGHECRDCPQPREGRLYVHHYHRHQRTAEKQREIHEAKVRGGKAAAEKRWAPHRAAKAAAAAKAETPEPAAAEPRDDVERLCNYLALWVERNDDKHKRPTVTKAWRNAARLLIDLDGYTVEEIKETINWCQRSAFWAPNVRSMVKLREKFKEFRGKMRGEQQGDRGRPGRPAPQPVNYEGQNDDFLEQFGQGQLPINVEDEDAA